MSTPPATNSAIRQHLGVQREIGRDALDAGHRDGGAQPRQRLRAIAAVRDDLAEQRIVERRHARAGLDMRIDADALALRPAH